MSKFYISSRIVSERAGTLLVTCRNKKKKQCIHFSYIPTRNKQMISICMIYFLRMMKMLRRCISNVGVVIQVDKNMQIDNMTV